MTIAVSLAHLRFEHYPSGLGVSHASPRLSWRFEGDARDWKQVGYEVRVTRAGKTESYAVDSPESLLVPWPSAPLASRDAAAVEVRARGADGWTAWVAADVEAALLKSSDWVAKPTTSSVVYTPAKDEVNNLRIVPDKNAKAKQPFRLRKTFTLASVPKTARLYVTAQGVHTTYINGQRLPDLLEPGWTSYQHNLNYRAYNVAPLLKAGENVIASWIGEGWYAGRFGFGGGIRDIWGARPALIAQLEVDGQVAAATGQDGWAWAYGATTQGEIYDGETYDSNVDDVEWLTAATPDGDWKAAHALQMPDVNITTPEIPPVREYARLKVADVITTPSGKTILDMGQNFAGYLEIVKQPASGAGTTVVLSHAEVLEKGELGIRPLRQCYPVDHVVLGGNVVGWAPKFTFHGFRYVEVTGWPGTVTGDEFEGVAISSNYDRTGTFESSHPKLNRLHDNVVWSIRANTISVPTDCPQRDERMGWTGDVEAICPTINYLFDSAGFFRNWLRDLRDDQKAAGGIVPIVIPWMEPMAFLRSPHAIWGDVSAILPDELYKTFGDREILAETYESMKLWLDSIPRSEDRLWDTSVFQFSDWLAPKAPPDRPGQCDSDPYLVTDGFLIHTTRTVVKIARILGHEADATKLEAEARTLLRTFHDTYVTNKNRVVSDTQTALAIILHFDLTDPERPEQKEIFAKRLAFNVDKEEWHVATGFAGTPLILPTLAENGELSHAYRMLLNKGCPSWMYPVLMGATSIWERWDSMLPDGSINPGEMTSFNHYALGAVAQFMHNTIGGLTPAAPGWQRAIIRPQPGGNLTHATARFKSPYGDYACAWVLDGQDLTVDVEVPPNTTAQVVLPGVDEVVGSGKRQYKVKWEGQAFPPASRGEKIPGVEDKADRWVRE